MSSRLRNPHGFFGRHGGVSEDVYASLNCGFGSDDDPARVKTNRGLVRERLGADALQTCHQIHSADAVFVSEPVERPEADGLVTTTPGLALGVLHADCAPVLLESKSGHVVGACHAGWRGAVAGITDATVALMREHGAMRIRAVVGPCIGLRSYEVGEDFRMAAMEADPETEDFFRMPSKPLNRWFRIRPPQRHSAWIGDGLHFDLPGYVAHRLDRVGVDVRSRAFDTYAGRKTFFSYRRNTHEGVADYGRNISAICIPPRTSRT